MQYTISLCSLISVAHFFWRTSHSFTLPASSPVAKMFPERVFMQFKPVSWASLQPHTSLPPAATSDTAIDLSREPIRGDYPPRSQKQHLTGSLCLSRESFFSYADVAALVSLLGDTDTDAAAAEDIAFDTDHTSTTPLTSPAQSVCRFIFIHLPLSMNEVSRSTHQARASHLNGKSRFSMFS